MENNKTCCVIAQCEIENYEEVKDHLFDLIYQLTLEENVKNFLFCGYSEFYYFCNLIIDFSNRMQLNLKKIVYSCPRETYIIKDKKTELLQSLKNHGRVILIYDEEIKQKGSYLFYKHSHKQRIKTLINKSDYCIFYYEEKTNNKHNKNDSCPTDLTLPYALKYAQKKKKTIFNMAV